MPRPDPFVSCGCEPEAFRRRVQVMVGPVGFGALGVLGDIGMFGILVSAWGQRQARLRVVEAVQVVQVVHLNALEERKKVHSGGRMLADLAASPESPAWLSLSPLYSHRSNLGTLAWHQIVRPFHDTPPRPLILVQAEQLPWTWPAAHLNSLDLSCHC